MRHYLCRPPSGATEVEVFRGGKWIPDDGKPAFAFSGKVGFFPYAWATDCGDRCCNNSAWPQKCVHEEAMNRTGARFGCANGRYVPPFSKKVAARLREAERKRTLSCLSQQIKSAEQEKKNAMRYHDDEIQRLKRELEREKAAP